MKLPKQLLLKRTEDPCIPKTKRLVRKIKTGKNQRKSDLFHPLWHDLYHWLLSIPWSQFLLVIILVYFGVNFLFALAYLTTGNGITNADPGSLLDAFFFSIQTLSTVGYGSMYPQTLYAEILVTIEILTGLLFLAVLTGLMFARFSRPTARVIFSQVAVICPYDGIPTLMFRAANRRDSHILEAQIQVSFLRNETTQEGHYLRRFYDLKLTRARTPVFGLSWLVMHPIDENSPFYQQTAESLAGVDAELWITLTGIDEIFSQTIHARYSYGIEDLLWNMRFVDIFSRKPNGDRFIDLGLFHDVIPIETH